MRYRTWLLLALASVAGAADFSVPVLGFLYDGDSKSIRPILGSPGAAVIGTATDEHRYEKAVVSGDKGIGVGVAVDTSGVVRIAPQEAPVAIPDALAKFDFAALSRGGSSAVLYSKECMCVQVLTDLASTARVLRTLRVADEVRALTVNDDASLTAIALTSSKVLIVAGEQVREIEGDAIAVALSSDGGRLAVADEVRKNVALYATAGEALEVVYTATEHDGINSPKALWFVSASRVLVADGSGAIHVVEPEAGPLRSTSCACAPDTFARTTASGVMRITGIGAGAAWVLQATDDRLDTLFVPTVRPAEVAQ